MRKQTQKRKFNNLKKLKTESSFGGSKHLGDSLEKGKVFSTLLICYTTFKSTFVTKINYVALL